ncbi:ABC transporter ATP-binding protein [Paenibacillus sp. JCM 10914]|uniref:ATP-binding cassette domain-containing protein n=1 Tax=Paenibacillus sp. JCM 10914 TaxID=1236974 RepID=UPI0003CC3BFA|nr:ABC transporter ATP-binding protein [Paenibacillus sp. JCM 10914]GAE04881.1 ABC transporter, ATP-binding protein [Paenibacillus sp. JCM 10914]
MQQLLTLSDVHKRYGTLTVLQQVNWTISKGECVALTGGNGAGKSTLLQLIAKLAHPTTGSRIEHMEPIMIGFVPERFPALRFKPSEYLSHMAAIRGMSQKAAAKRIDAIMSVFRLQDTRMTLSSKGMLQKVNVMQALLMEPDLLVLDEPLSGLDESSQMEMIRVLTEIKRQGTAIAMSVHEPLLISSVADRVTQIDQGRIERDGMLERKRPLPRMKLECSGLNEADKMELEQHAGFLYWRSTGTPTALIVHERRADELLLLILRMGGSIVRVEPWNGEEGLARSLPSSESGVMQQ